MTKVLKGIYRSGARPRTCARATSEEINLLQGCEVVVFNPTLMIHKIHIVALTERKQQDHSSCENTTTREARNTMWTYTNVFVSWKSVETCLNCCHPPPCLI